VFPVAGVPSKALAAVSLGCTSLICPPTAQVLSDLLERKPVKTLKDLLAHAFVTPEGKRVELIANLEGTSINMTRLGARFLALIKAWSYYCVVI
jgi:hypothetical protein